MASPVIFMSDIRKPGVQHNIDNFERNLIFNLNVLDECIEKFGKMDNILNSINDIKTVIWLAVIMYNEDAEIWNDEHPDNKKPLLDEKYLKRRIDGMGGITELIKKVNEAILKGLPPEAVEKVEELGKNLMTAQGKS